MPEPDTTVLILAGVFFALAGGLLVAAWRLTGQAQQTTADSLAHLARAKRLLEEAREIQELAATASARDDQAGEERGDG